MIACAVAPSLSLSHDVRQCDDDDSSVIVLICPVLLLAPLLEASHYCLRDFLTEL